MSTGKLNYLIWGIEYDQTPIGVIGIYFVGMFYHVNRMANTKSRPRQN